MRHLLKRLSRTVPAQWIMAGIIIFYIWLIYITSRQQRMGTLPAGQKIIALWHSRLAMATFYDRGHWPLYAMVSLHPDGRIITKVARLHGLRGVHGSSREGALSGFRQALRAIQNGGSLLLTPDGPTGPRQHAQQGVAELARMTGLPVYPVSFSAQKCIHLKSWDRGLIPLPFTTLVIAYGTPLHLPRHATPDETAAFVTQLAHALTRTQNTADLAAGQPLIPPASAEELATRAAKDVWKTRRVGAKK